MKNKPIIALQRNYLLILLTAWLLIQVLLLSKYGIVTDKEAIKYSREANNFLLHKNFSEQKYIFYSIYIFIHSLFIKLGFETQGVYVFQLLINLVSTFLFFKTALNVYKNINVAFVAALLLIICFSWQYWTICLYTESFFCSMLIIFTYCVFGINKKVKLKYMYAIFAFCILLFARPTGILLIPVLICMIIYRLFELRKVLAAILCIIFLSIAFFYLLYYEMSSAASFDFIKPFIERNVICDVQDKTITLSGSNYTDNTSSLLLYIKENPRDFFRLCGLRFLAFWGLIRSYYSAAHNLLLQLFFYPLYFFMLVKLKQLAKLNRYFVLYCLGILSVFTISVMLTCDEWSNRFIMPIIPIIILLASYGIITLFKRKSAEAMR